MEPQQDTQGGRRVDAPADSDKRLTELEVKVGFADDLLDQLNRTVFRQQQQIEQLARELAALRERVREMADTPRTARDPGDEVPPHY